MTYAEQARENGRDDEHMVYEMFMFSQYSDGSVLNCHPTTINPWRTLTAQEVAAGKATINADNAAAAKVAKEISGDLKRNAKAALKNGTTKTLAPRV
jgi:hypothetical protein